jgi:bifunctional DNA-binding transcriptional regulator/antitoxin component of YhaV-PrlF toxin-antitoxin module
MAKTHQVVSVTYDIDAQAHRDGQFSVPKEVCDLLGVNGGDKVRVVIETPEGRTPPIDTELRSGKEIYGPEIRAHVKAGQRIRVTVSRPQSG